MKRSELNRIIGEAIAFVEGRGLCFPEFAKWGPERWARLTEGERELVDNMLGWDVSDFGGDFARTGLLIFTFRNGNFHHQDKYPKPYAEKYLLVNDGQVLPYHYHWYKMEDTINRGGGDLRPEGRLQRKHHEHGKHAGAQNGQLVGQIHWYSSPKRS